MSKPHILRWLKKKRVAVLKGGWSRERAISLKTGKAVEDSLRRMRVRSHSIDVQEDIETVLKKKKIQFAILCLHGTFGEDGQVQSLLDRLKIQYTGSGAIASSLAMNKATSKVLFQEAGLKTAPWALLSKSHFLEDPIKSTKNVRTLLSRGPIFIKPVDQGSAIGISYVKKRKLLFPSLKKCFAVSDQALIEKYIKGRELTVGLLGRRALPLIEIRPEHDFYDYYSKYAKGGSRHLIPVSLPSSKVRHIQTLAKKAFRVLGCKGYGRVDFILDQRGVPMILEVNTIPGMTPTSLLPEAAKHVGISFDDLVLQICSFSMG